MQNTKPLGKDVNKKEYPKSIKQDIPDTRILISYKLKQS